MSDVQEQLEQFWNHYEHQKQQQEERQQKILEALETFKIHLEEWYKSDNCEEGLEFFLDKLNFIASECGVGDQWRKRNGN